MQTSRDHASAAGRGVTAKTTDSRSKRQTGESQWKRHCSVASFARNPRLPSSTTGNIFWAELRGVDFLKLISEPIINHVCESREMFAFYRNWNNVKSQTSVGIFVLFTWNWLLQTNVRTFEGLKTNGGPRKFWYGNKFGTFSKARKVRI